MTSTPYDDFRAALASATTQHAAYDALYRYSDAVVPVRLWTVMSVDHDAGLARRAFTNMPEAYPASGTKPMIRNDWSDIVLQAHQCFVANTLDEIAGVFSDYALIGSLGCGSVLNLPVVVDGSTVGTINLLDTAHHFTDTRVQACKDLLTAPARDAMVKARDLP